MSRHSPWSSTFWLALALGVGPGLTGCTRDEPASPQTEARAEHAAAEADAPDSSPADPTPETTKPPPLSEEDLALLAADPKDLTPEQRRARAYARRRQIMQNPDSPIARALQDLADAHQAGEIDATPREGVWFSLPGTKPTHGRPPAGWRPPKDEPSAAPSTAPNAEGASSAPAAPSLPASAGASPAPAPAAPSPPVSAGASPTPAPAAPDAPSAP